MSRQIALHSLLREGCEHDYDVTHARIPDDLLAAHLRAGIRDWQIWRSGRHLFHLVDCDDFDAARRLLDEDPANDRWQAVIGPLVDHFETSPSGSWELRAVWRMRDQADGAPSPSK